MCPGLSDVLFTTIPHRTLDIPFYSFALCASFSIRHDFGVFDIYLLISMNPGYPGSPRSFRAICAALSYMHTNHTQSTHYEIQVVISA